LLAEPEFAMKCGYPFLLFWWTRSPPFILPCHAFQINTHPRRAMEPLHGQSHDAPSEVSSIHPNNPIKRKKKKNKYQEFSKVQDKLLDPLESLIAESEKKQQILTEQSKTWKAARPVEIAPLPKIEFPDNKDIDVSSPLPRLGEVEFRANLLRSSYVSR
jgi:hypothetical protein